jgi:NAD-dependent deacetylase
MKRIVVFTGAGMSAESGLSTFRDKGGLWDKYDISQVATPEAFARDPEMVLEFYNIRRRELLNVKPNDGHKALVEWEQKAEVHIITQNIDDLHERAGSTHVLHLHGELRKARSTADENLIIEIDGSELVLGDLCPLGSQLRPHVVWFGEEVPEMLRAEEIVAQADVLVVVGTSLNVYPAAGLLWCVAPGTPIWLIDPNPISLPGDLGITHLMQKAGEALPNLIIAN